VKWDKTGGDLAQAKFQDPEIFVGRSLESYTVFADDGEHGQEIGEAEELPNPLANVEELHLASCRASRGVKTDEGAEAHAVHAGDIRQVQHDSFGGWDDGADLGVKDVGQLRDELSVASHDCQVVGMFDLKRQARRSWFVRHQALSIRNIIKMAGNGFEEVSHTAARRIEKSRFREVVAGSDADCQSIELLGNHSSN
jgi:hypothetical protein